MEMEVEMERSTPCIELPWDSKVFGFKIASLRGNRLSPAIVAEVMTWCGRQGIRCLYFCADGTCSRTISLAHQAGFKFVDVRLALEYSVPPIRETFRRGVVRRATPEDLPVLKEIAGQAHSDTRFFKDEMFPVEQVRTLYAMWICRDFAEHQVLVAIVDCASGPEIGGYISCEMGLSNGHGRIGLLAVRDRHRGKGLGSSLVSAALDLIVAGKCSSVEVATQASNIAAQRLYQSHGFRTSSSGIWFHKWFDAGKTGQPS